MVYEFQRNFKNEKDFQREYFKRLKEDWYRVYKLPDVGYNLKPCDIVALKDWEFIGIELKYWIVNEYDRIYRMLRPNQVWWLLHIQQHWGTSLVVWRDSKENKMYEYQFKYKQYEWAL